MLITARRNSNLLLLPFALIGLPFEGYLALAAWVIFSLVVHCARYTAALAARRRGVWIATWLEA
ncbi:MAG: hypothetical protein WBN68_07830 [Sedimenticolaceae bacterium]